MIGEVVTMLHLTTGSLGLWNCFVAGMWKSLVFWVRKSLESWTQGRTGHSCDILDDRNAKRNTRVKASILRFQRWGGTLSGIVAGVVHVLFGQEYDCGLHISLKTQVQLKSRGNGLSCLAFRALKTGEQADCCWESSCDCWRDQRIEGKPPVLCWDNKEGVLKEKHCLEIPLYEDSNLFRRKKPQLKGFPVP